jgi:hypothetical protein
LTLQSEHTGQGQSAVEDGDHRSGYLELLDEFPRGLNNLVPRAQIGEPHQALGPDIQSELSDSAALCKIDTLANYCQAGDGPLDRQHEHGQIYVPDRSLSALTTLEAQVESPPQVLEAAGVPQSTAPEPSVAEGFGGLFHAKVLRHSQGLLS